MSEQSLSGARRVSDLQREAISTLREGGLEDCSRDVRFLLAHLLNIEAGLVPTKGSDLVSHKGAARFADWISQRATGKPVHRIIGSRAFYGRDFAFNDDCLEPRPETELLVERVLADFGADKDVRFAEVGVGSGVIAVSLLCELPAANGVGTDISEGAIEATRKNAVTFGVSDRLELVKTDCLGGVTGAFDFIVSNPPYIESADIAMLSREVREHDPIAALDGGVDGLEIYRRLLDQAMNLLVEGGRLYFETGHGQHDDICGLAVKNGWGVISRHLDLSGLERIVVLSKGRNASNTAC